MRRVVIGEKHHWWPQGLSRHWKDDQGAVHRIDPSGRVVDSTPKQFGQITDGHNILPAQRGPWDTTIEDFFDFPDQSMPSIVEWLSSLARKETNHDDAGRVSFAIESEQRELDVLRECILSLIIRSPRYRNNQSDFVESLRGELPKKELKTIVAANLNQKYGNLVEQSKGVGKFVALYAQKAEFIFGDGVYSNINAVTEGLHGLKVAVPLTPEVAVLWSSPMASRDDPRLIGSYATDEMVHKINDSVQVYSKESLFFRTNPPRILEAFSMGQHRVYTARNDPVGELVESFIPDERLTRWRSS